MQVTDDIRTPVTKTDHADFNHVTPVRELCGYGALTQVLGIQMAIKAVAR
jgi:hypothetical protein